MSKLWEVSSTHNSWYTGNPEDNGIYYVVAETISKAVKLAEAEHNRRWVEQDTGVLDHDGFLKLNMETKPFVPRTVKLLSENLLVEEK